MKKAIIALGLLLSLNSTAQQPPKAPASPVSDNYFGTTIVDKYRNLENLKNEETLNWMKAQANYTNAVLNSIPGKQKIIDKLVELDARRAEKISSLTILENGKYFYLKTTPKDIVAKLYMKNNAKDVETLIFNPETYVANSKEVHSIGLFSANKKGNLVAINVNKNGGEMAEMIIVDVLKKEILPEKIDKIKFSPAAWLKDDKSFMYVQAISGDIHNMASQSDLNTKIHKLGTDISTDRLFFSRASALGLINADEIPLAGADIENNNLMFIPMSVNRNLKIYVADSKEIDLEKKNWKLLIDRDQEIKTYFVHNKQMYFYTSLNAKNFKLCRTSYENPDYKNAKEIIAENKNAKLESITTTKNGIFYTVNFNGLETKLYYTDFEGNNIKEIITPKKAATIGMRSRGDKYNDLWITIAGWISPSETYKYDSNKNEFKREELSTVVSYPEFENFEVKEITVKSHDGVLVPMSLIHKKGLAKDGKTPVLFYGYGSYGMSMTPSFNVQHLLWVEKGGILAIAHVRGGGELGEKWHLDGKKATKPNTWKDVIACTEYMINEGYTNATKTAIYSRSAGGIFVGRAITERPDLYAVAIPGVGSMNTVRGEKTPNGPANIAEFGTMEKESEAKALIEMDSYLNLKEGEKYPATLTTAGFNDPRIIVWQPAKFAARMLEVNTSNKPSLLKVDYEAGHFGGATKAKSYEEIADVFSFALWQVGHPEFQPLN
ncbi:prolyl oligopeptidase family serine peptidase [Flavobacterium laiguense]|uniref:prolyl oligopeptidase n=1 Tax=Flavobacterium laiguense TaxID=2169409 RepID=A0A2U1K2U2_9FLAO|nr:prolyl oligopeptidase family serine peptidase [Flavobacterium laiguense]PWA11504.1 S9 family peptidase [Flavobacterium laiguense]